MFVCLFFFCCKDRTKKEILTGKRQAGHQGQDNRVTEETKPQEQDRWLYFGPFVYAYINFIDKSDRINHLRTSRFIMIISYSFCTTLK